MRKIFLGILLVASMGILSGCLVTDNHDEYERQQFRSTEEISEISVTDSSTNYTLQISDTEELLVEYSDSPTQSWYNIDVADGTLKIEKTQGTVGVEENSVIITLPEKEYQSIAIETSNGDITCILTQESSVSRLELKNSAHKRPEGGRKTFSLCCAESSCMLMQ